MNFLYLSSDRMGDGDDPELGRRLLVTFLDKLAASERRVDLVGCVNGAVRLTTEDGPALESLRRLEARGARIASCGTCLDHTGRRDELRVGVVGDMATTIDVLATADRVIRP